MARNTFNRLLNRKSGTSPEMAIRLSKVFRGSTENWLAFQESFDLDKVRKTVDTSTLNELNLTKLRS